MSIKVKKRIAPTLLDPNVVQPNNIKSKKNAFETTADLIAMRYGVSTNAPEIDNAVFQQNRAIGKKVVPLKEYFEEAAKKFEKEEKEKKKEISIKKREIAKLSPCQRKIATFKRNIVACIKECGENFSNDDMLQIINDSRLKVNTSSKQQKKKTLKKGGKITKLHNSLKKLFGKH